MKKKNKSWVSSYANAVIADMASQNSPRGSLAKKHTGKIALRYALQTRAIWRLERIRKILFFSGVMGMIAFVVMNWR